MRNISALNNKMTIENARKLLKVWGEKLSDEQLKGIIDLFYFWAKIEVSNYLQKKGEESNINHYPTQPMKTSKKKEKPKSCG